MKIRVRLFANLREHVGKSECTLEVPAGTRVVDLLARLSSDPRFGEQCAPSLLFAINQRYVARETIVTEGDEVALMPPVAGG